MSFVLDFGFRRRLPAPPHHSFSWCCGEGFVVAFFLFSFLLFLLLEPFFSYAIFYSSNSSGTVSPDAGVVVAAVVVTAADVAVIASA